MIDKFTEKTRVSDEDRKKALYKFLIESGEYKEDELSVGDMDISSYNPRMVEFGRREYLVCTDDEADEEFREYQENLWDEMGIDSFTPSFRDWIMNNAVTVSSTDERLFTNDIADMVNESPESYGNWIDYDALKDELLKSREFISYVQQEFADDLVEEDVTAKEYAEDYLLNDNEDEILNTYVEYLDFYDHAYEIAQKIIGQYDSIMEYILDQGLYSSAKEAFDSMNIFQVDFDAIVEEVQSLDGRGSSLAGYDGEENEVDYDGETFYIYRHN